jgi:hypothetical protein
MSTAQIAPQDKGTGIRGDRAVHARMIHLNAPFGHHFFEVAQAQRVRDISAHAQNDDIQR